VLTIGIVGFLIWIMGFIASMNGGTPIDILGIGLVGTSGLLKYLAIVAVIVGIGVALVMMINRGWFWTGALMHFLIRIPMLGKCLQYLALSRIAWALSMSIDAGMEAIASLKLALRASQNVYYSSAWPAVEAAMEHRVPMADALRKSGRFPEEFLQVLETGELSGMVSETLDHHAADLRARAEGLLKALTVMAGVACSMLVMLMVGLVILRIGMFYVGTINDALEMTK
jgi:type II secretory pathway component PulF